jgi:hypothetical protein
VKATMADVAASGKHIRRWRTKLDDMLAPND